MRDIMNNILFEDLNGNYGFYFKPGKKILSYNSKYQKIDLYKSQLFGKLLRIDNINQVGIIGEKYYHEPMAHLPMLSHKSPKSVLVIGGGDGGINREVLKYKSVESLVHVELDAKVVDLCKKHLPEISRACWEDPRTKLVIEDGRKYLTNNKDSFDVVIMDMTDPFGPSSTLYTKEFFTLVKYSLKNKHGVFCMHSESPITRPEAFSSIHRTLEKVFKKISPWYIYVQMYGTYWSFAICSDTVNMRKNKSRAIDKKIKKLGLKHLEVVTGDTYEHYQTEMPIIKRLRKSDFAKIITDRDFKFLDEQNLKCYHERN